MTTLRPAPRPLLPQGVLFDLFGTLVRPERTQLAAVGPNSSDTFEAVNTAGLLRWAAARRLPTPPEAAAVVGEARRWLWAETGSTGRQVLNREAIERIAPRLGWPRDPALLAEAAWVFFQPEIAMIEPYADAAEAVAALRQMGLRLAVVSNASDHRLVTAVLDRLSLAGFFDPIISSAGFGRVKPDPGIFRAVLDQWRLDGAQAVMVGDTLDADINGAQAVGLRAILVTMDPNPANAALTGRVAPDAAAASLTEVVAILRRWRHPA
jgi:HAD superfamily hydrolase (TIGR01509 family)